MIYKYLSNEQISKIVSVIQIQCDKAARKEFKERSRISDAVYDRLKKGRKAHDITGDIYIGFFYDENKVDGLSTEMVDNGIYSQPELVGANVFVHIYHKSNPLNSGLVKERAKVSDKQLICIRYAVDKASRLKSVEWIAIGKDGVKVESGELYSAPKLTVMAS